MPDLIPETGLKEYWEKGENVGSFRKIILVDYSHNLVSIGIQVNGVKQRPRGVLFCFHTQENLPKSIVCLREERIGAKHVFVSVAAVAYVTGGAVRVRVCAC